jgi:hypothetical protein
MSVAPFQGQLLTFTEAEFHNTCSVPIVSTMVPAILKWSPVEFSPYLGSAADLRVEFHKRTHARPSEIPVDPSSELATVRVVSPKRVNYVRTVITGAISRIQTNLAHSSTKGSSSRFLAVLSFSATAALHLVVIRSVKGLNTFRHVHSYRYHS